MIDACLIELKIIHSDTKRNFHYACFVPTVYTLSKSYDPILYMGFNGKIPLLIHINNILQISSFRRIHFSL
jgi:hypothetical protein